MGLRLYLLMLVEGICWSILFFPLSIFIVLVVYSAGVAMVVVVGVGRCMVWAMYWLCCVLVALCGFVLDCGIIVMFLPHCIVYCRVPGLHCARGLTGTWSVFLSTVSFLLYVRIVGACVIIGSRAVDCTRGLVCYPNIWPIVKLISCALRRSNHQLVSVYVGVGPLGFVF